MRLIKSDTGDIQISFTVRELELIDGAINVADDESWPWNAPKETHVEFAKVIARISEIYNEVLSNG